MKSALIFSILIASAAGAFAAEPFVAPKFIKELEDLPSVKRQATRENKGISFLLMEPGSG